MVPDIEIQHLSVCFDTAQGPVYAVNDLSTTFQAGRISGVIGESGSGKSVMGMSLLRLLPNTARVTGKCFFGEDELYSMPLRRLRRLRGAAIGLIPQNPGASLDPVMKLRRQLTEAITTHGRWKRREAEAQAAELLRRFGFEEPERILNQYSFQMSGGMNQRLVSALGLACRPGWVIADEPTKGLDAVPGRKLHFLQMHPVRPACLRSIGIEAKLIPFTLIVQTEHVITPRVKDHHDRVRQLGQSRLGRNIDISPNLILHLLHSHVERIKFCHKMHLQIQEWDTKTETASPAELITAKKPGLKPPDHHRSS